jgi:pimeloyl-ACP methyl ester carboxylesterase
MIAPRPAARRAFNLFCYPVRPKLKSHHADFLNSSEKFQVDLNGLRIQGYKWGNGSRKVLFLHGWQSHTFRWKNYINSLSRNDLTILAFDAPGHGFSGGNFLSVPLYSEAIEHFISQQGGVDTVVSHSIASFSILYTLYRLPLLPVNRIVAMAPPGEAQDFIDHFQQQLRLSPRAMSLAVDYFQKTFDQPVSFFSAKRFAAALAVPGLIIHDRDDDETPFEYARQLNDVWKKSALIQTTGLGHNLRSAEVTNIVCDYILRPAAYRVAETNGLAGGRTISVILPN